MALAGGKWDRGADVQAFTVHAGAQHRSLIARFRPSLVRHPVPPNCALTARDLSDNTLTGSIPATVGNLDALVAL